MEIPLQALFDTFALDATVSMAAAPDPVETQVIWLPTDMLEDPTGGDAAWVEYLQRKEPRGRDGQPSRQVAVLKRADVPALAVGDRFAAPEVPDGAVLEWTVAAFVGVEADLVRVAVQR